MEESHLFFAKKNRILDDEQHLAEMVSLMGPPPPEFLQRSENRRRFWDGQGMFYLLHPMILSFYICITGNWKGPVPIPEQSLESRELHKGLFLNLRKIFRWLPEERPTTEELAYDDFLMQNMFTAGVK